MASIDPGAYFIFSQSSGQALAFTSGSEGTNLTAWNFDGTPHQTWKIAAGASHYTVQNVQYGTYASFSNGSLSNPFVTSSPAPFSWLVVEYKGGYMLAAAVPGQDLVTDVWNLEGRNQGEGDDVILYPWTATLKADNFVWYFNSTTTASTSASATLSQTSSTSQTSSCTTIIPTISDTNLPVILGSTLGGCGAILLIIFAFFLGRRRGVVVINKAASKRRQSTISQYQLTPLWASTPYVVQNKPTSHDNIITGQEPQRNAGSPGYSGSPDSSSPPRPFTSPSLGKESTNSPHSGTAILPSLTPQRGPTQRTAWSGVAGGSDRVRSPPPVYRDELM